AIDLASESHLGTLAPNGALRRRAGGPSPSPKVRRRVFAGWMGVAEGTNRDEYAQLMEQAHSAQRAADPGWHLQGFAVGAMGSLVVAPQPEARGERHPGLAPGQGVRERRLSAPVFLRPARLRNLPQ